MDVGCTKNPTPRDPFEGVYRDHQSSVFGFCLRLTRHLQDAEDLAQETFLRGFRRFDRLESLEAARPWLLRIAVNAYIGIYRRRRRRDEATWAPDEVIGALDARVTVHRPEAPDPVVVHGEVLAAVESLPVAFREAITLVDLGEAEYAEAAEVLAVPVGTVMSRLHRGRALLRERLAGYVGPMARAA